MTSRKPFRFRLQPTSHTAPHSHRHPARPGFAFERISLTVAVTFLMVLAAIAPVPGGVSGADTITAVDRASVEAASNWLLAQQLPSGGFPGFSGEADAGATADAVLALAAARQLGIDVAFDDAIAFLADGALVLAQTGPGSAAKLALAVVAIGQDPHDFAFVDPLAIVVESAKGGQIGFGAYDHALGLLALAAGGESIAPAALQYALDTQTELGGWAFDGSDDPALADSNTTALMIQALCAVGACDSPEVADGLAFLSTMRDASGAYRYQNGGPTDANSTALAVQALIAAGAAADAAHIDAGIQALLAFQNDDGSFSYLLEPADANLFATVQAIPAVAGQALPIGAGDRQAVAVDGA